jgi:hypothetical protein
VLAERGAEHAQRPVDVHRRAGVAVDGRGDAEDDGGGGKH